MARSSPCPEERPTTPASSAICSSGSSTRLPATSASEVFPDDLRLWIPAQRTYTYPDTSIVQGELQLSDRQSNAMTNPACLFEVLSPSTEDYDLGGKFVRYRTLPSLQEYILIDSSCIAIDRYVRQDESTWLLTIYDDPAATLALTSAPVQLANATLYQGVTFETAEPEANGSG